MGLFQHHGQRSHPVASGPQGLALGFFGVRWSLGLRGCGASTKSFHDRDWSVLCTGWGREGGPAPAEPPVEAGIWPGRLNAGRALSWNVGPTEEYGT